MLDLILNGGSEFIEPKEVKIDWLKQPKKEDFQIIWGMLYRLT